MRLIRRETTEDHNRMVVPPPDLEDDESSRPPLPRPRNEQISGGKAKDAVRENHLRDWKILSSFQGIGEKGKSPSASAH